MNKGKKVLSGLLAGVLMVSMVLTASATDIQGLKKQQQQLEEQQKDAKAEKSSLAAKVNKLNASMKQAQADIEAKQTEIEETEQELLMAKIEENHQYESMKVRIRYMYENGNVNLIQLFMESDSIADFFHKTESISKISEYDRKKLEEYQLTVRAVEEKELTLQSEYEKLQALRESLVKQQAEAEALLAEKSSELASIEANLSELETSIKNAEDAAKKLQEQNEGNKNQTTNNSSGSNSSGNSNSGSGSSSSTQVSKPVVSGNGYFTHPCPGMSYQSSYFGEVRQGIGDDRPHKGHDYAAPKGTPIYAAAAGTVIYARYSSSAGYWVVIDHDNGLVTKYMHMFEMPYVSEGQKVVKGQHIGGVGTTGQSTGNHLHFQVELNGVAVNPDLYM
ncbi:MAG: peptidoglycan DD-metalloendopeptidase family protein [Tyzzerella sp.]|nr:peptidoglycan DD-metalloendopeptidase family protein [Tyzzerella sp.]